MRVKLVFWGVGTAFVGFWLRTFEELPWGMYILGVGVVLLFAGILMKPKQQFA